MKIRITKLFDKNELKCTRSDGSTNSAKLGPSFAAHDIAHYVVENHLKLSKGFFGQIANGKTIQLLSEPLQLKNVDPELWLSEILTRNLQNLLSGGSSINDYIELVKWECDNMNLTLPNISKDDVELILNTYKDIMQHYDRLGLNESIHLEFQ